MPPMISSRPSTAGPPDSGTGSRTAPVLEFICLFTHDLRRKQKRWEDGRLRYHTFNKRVMVYDERGNFVGDMHWHREWDFDEGEEVQLERGGVIVQVVECVGRQEQDLSELLDKRAKEREQRQARLAIRSSLAATSAHSPQLANRIQQHFQTRHRPLNQLLGAPTGHYGRAVVPTESPFELRQRVNEASDDRADTRPPKKRKCDATPPGKLGYAQSLFGATLSLSAVPLSSAPPRRPVGQASQAHRRTSSPPADAQSGLNHSGPACEPSDKPRRLATPGPDNFREPSEPLRQLDQNLAPLAGQPVAVVAGDLKRSCPTKTLSISRVNNPCPAGVDEDQPGLADIERPGIQVANQLVPPERIGRQHHEGIAMEMDPLGTESEFPVPSNSKAGVSRSQAIVLGDDASQEPDDTSPHFQAAGTAVDSRRLTPDLARPSAAKRRSLPRPTENPRVGASRSVEGRQDGAQELLEERTELRLKPRQRRGLLLLSEKSNTIQAAKRQRPIQTPRTGATSEKAITHAPRAVTRLPANLAGNPFASLSLPDDYTPQQAGPRLPPRQPRQALRALDGAKGESGLLVPSPGAHTSVGKGAISKHLKSSQAAFETSAKSRAGVLRLSEYRFSPKPPDHRHAGEGYVQDDETQDVPSPPRNRGSGVRGGSFEQVSKESSEQDGHAIIGPEAGGLKLAEQTQNTGKLDVQDSGHSKRNLQRAEPDKSDGEELPSAPVGPRLARLRKSVRSREVFGFVPSSSPINVSIPAQPSLGLAGHNPSAGGPAAISGPPDSPCQELRLLEGRQASENTYPAPLRPAALSRAAPPAFQRHNSVPDRRVGESNMVGSRQEQGKIPTAEWHDDALRRRSLARHKSAVIPQTNLEDKVSATSIPAPGLQSIDAGEQDTVPAVTASHNINAKKRPPAVGTTAQRSQGPRSCDAPPVEPLDDAYINGTDDGVTEDTNRHAPDGPPGNAGRPKIANPATRGRKAALRSDAAGQVPQPILPAEPAPGRLGMPAPAVPRPDRAPNERPKRKMTFPGFVSARGGGPWSREAHDLLESARPG